jgi:signal transduction protein with GAF and PtsI domain
VTAEAALDDAGLQQLRTAVAAVRSVFGAAACSVALLDETGERLEFVAADGAGADAIVGTALPVGRGIVGWVATSGQPIAVAEVESDARFARDVAEATDYVPSVILAAPLPGVGDDVLGVMELLDPIRTGEAVLGDLRGSAAELAVLTTVAGVAAAVVEANSWSAGRDA